MKNQFFVCLDAEIAEVVNIEQQKLLPAPVLILILYQVLFHGVFDLGENRHDFIECFFGDVTNIAIVFGLYGCCASILIRDESNFTEVGSWTEDLHEDIVSVLISNLYFALALRNEEKLGGDLTLSYDDFFGIVHK